MRSQKRVVTMETKVGTITISIDKITAIEHNTTTDKITLFAEGLPAAVELDGSYYKNVKELLDTIILRQN